MAKLDLTIQSTDIVYSVCETGPFTTVLYRYGSLYRVVQLVTLTVSLEEAMELPTSYREFRTLEEAEECFNNWISLY